MAEAVVKRTGYERSTPASCRVLVAEYNPITHDVLKLLLTQRGHQVDIATDGIEALAALRKNHYDVALLDVNLPGMDGLRLAETVKADADRQGTPRLIAITPDIGALLSDPKNSENFDRIIPKPLDIYQVGKIVEEQALIGRKKPAVTLPPSVPAILETKPAPKARSSSYFEDLGFQFLAWPGDIDARRLSARARQAALGDPRFDGILVKVPASIEELATIWQHKGLHVLPVIDLTGTLGAAADLDGTKLGLRDTDLLQNVVRTFQDQRERLHRDLLFTDDHSEKLLGRVFVSDRRLTACFDPQSRSLVRYNTILGPSSVTREAEKLREEGLLKREFFERFHVCGRCDSYRLNVREECSNCRSSDLAEEVYLHHFPCAFQGPEAEFRRGNDLICPKCRRELKHFGFDYDKPGSMLVCRACRHSSSEPAIGFVCLDCGAHADAESCDTRDMFSYQLTDEGTGFAEYGRSLMGQARHAVRFAELPLPLAVALNAAAKRYSEEKVPFTLVNVVYGNEREITGEHGARQFTQVRDLFLENLKGGFPANDLIVKGQSSDFALLSNTMPEQARESFPRLRERGQENLRFDLGTSFQAFGPEDFS